MQLGAEAVFVGSGIFKSADPPAMAEAIVEATTHYARRRHRGQGVRGSRRRDARRGDPSVETRLPSGAGRPEPRGMGRSRQVARHGSACSPCRATFGSTHRACAMLGLDPVEVRVAGRPGRASTACRARAVSRRRCRCCSSRRACWPRLASCLAGGLPAFGTCAGMILLAGEVSTAGPTSSRFGADRHRRAPQRVRPPGRLASRPTSTSTGVEPTVAAVFIRAPWSSGPGPAVEVLAT